MSKKRLFGLLLFACLVTGILIISADYLTDQEVHTEIGQEQTFTEDDKLNNVEQNLVNNDISDFTKAIIENPDKVQNNENSSDTDQISDDEITKDDKKLVDGYDESETPDTVDIAQIEPWLSTNPSDVGMQAIQDDKQPEENEGIISQVTQDVAAGTYSTSVDVYEMPQLIIDCRTIDYEKFIPEMVIDSSLEVALDINNPKINIDAEAAILFDAKTKEVLYYKNAIDAKFPASTAKLLTSLVTLDWCKEEEQVDVGDEVEMIAYDSTRAYLKKGQVLSISNLLEAMLLPSGNDAAYVAATYVGRKSLNNTNASKEEAIVEFLRLMNEKAKSLGVKNSCFKTPDGYDAIGQYTTAYDMGLIGIAAADNDIIARISNKSSSRNIFVSGEDVTWNNTNKLITKYSGQYYSNAFGLKTGTSTMAGRCLVAAAEKDGKRVVCVVLDSSAAGRWEDAIAMLKYGLE